MEYTTSFTSDLTLHQWQTKWDRSNLFSNISPSAAIDFVTPGTAANADIIVDDTSVYQSVYGFGGTLSTSRSSSNGIATDFPY